MNNEAFDAFMRDILGDHPPKGSLCFCGTCVEAVEAAGRILKQTSDNGECVSWYLQVAAAMQVLGVVALFRRDGVTLETMMSGPEDPTPPDQLRVMRDWKQVCDSIPHDLYRELKAMPDGHITRMFELAANFQK